MELYTMDRTFTKEHTIDEFNSVIWTERYYGNSEFELVVPATFAMSEVLKENAFIGLVGSEEPMIIETHDIDEGKLKVTGTSIVPWLNNRFVRTSELHEDRYWYIEDTVPGAIMMFIVNYMCVGGPYLDGTINTGISNPEAFKLPGLYTPGWDTSGEKINYAVPFGPVYDALKELATTYQIGQKITYAGPDSGQYIMYTNYKGLDRTSSQSINSPVRFSPDMDSLTDIKELYSVKDFKTDVYTFAPGLPALATVPGVSTRLSGTRATGMNTDGAPSDGNYGFDRRAQMVFCDDITTDLVDGDDLKLVDVLNSRAKDELSNHDFVKVVDGQIVPTAQYQYGVHYNLGDIIELVGFSGITQDARITEYIRTQDTTGEKAYPTVAIITD